MDKLFFVRWFEHHGRDLPWRRRGVSPFGILVAELMLRQTTATAVARVWPSFIGKYSSPEKVVAERRERLVEHLRLLGLYHQRAEAVVAVSQHILMHHAGSVPDKVESLEAIQHIGKYTSRAILCFAFQQRVAVVDTNIMRLLSRVFALQSAPDIRRGKVKAIWSRAQEMLPESALDTVKHNYGLLDFSAELCRWRLPRCSDCELSTSSCHYSVMSNR
jgi:A/G-specific adenine glycosylase